MLKRVTIISSIVLVVALVLSMITLPLAVRDSTVFVSDILNSLSNQGSLGKIEVANTDTLTVYVDDYRIRIKQSFDDKAEITYSGVGFTSFHSESVVEGKTTKVKVSSQQESPPTENNNKYAALFDVVHRFVSLNDFAFNYVVNIYVPANINLHIKGNPGWISLDNEVEFLNKKQFLDDSDRHASVTIFDSTVETEIAVKDSYLQSAHEANAELREGFSDYMDGTISLDEFKSTADTYQNFLVDNLQGMLLQNLPTQDDLTQNPDLQAALDAGEAYLIAQTNYYLEVAPYLREMKTVLKNKTDFTSLLENRANLSKTAQEMELAVVSAKNKTLDAFFKVQSLVGYSSDNFLALLELRLDGF